MTFPEPSADAVPTAAGRTKDRGAAHHVALGAAAAFVAVALTFLGVVLATRGTGEMSVPAPGATTLLRAAVFGALSLHIGELAGLPVVRAVPALVSAPGTRPGVLAVGRGRVRVPAARTPLRAGPSDALLPGSLAVPAAVVGKVAATGQLALVCAVSGFQISAVWTTVEGRLLFAEGAGFVLAGVAAAVRGRWVAVLPLACVVTAEALRAQVGTGAGAADLLLAVVHLTAACLWTGGLLYVLRTVWTRRGAGAGALLGRYARRAGRLLVLVTGTGVAAALRKLPLEATLATAFGRVLLVKAALVLAACLSTLAVRRRLRRGTLATRPAHLEAAALVCVMLVSAVLTVVPDPRWLDLGR